MKRFFYSKKSLEIIKGRWYIWWYFFPILKSSIDDKILQKTRKVSLTKKDITELKEKDDKITHKRHEKENKNELKKEELSVADEDSLNIGKEESDVNYIIGKVFFYC